MVERLFQEHFPITPSGAHIKENKELPAGSLQSLDALEATYRTKGTQHYKGYVANVTETCDPENEVQLITKIQVASNNVAGSHLLQEALPDPKTKRTQFTSSRGSHRAFPQASLPGWPIAGARQVPHDLSEDRLGYARKRAQNLEIACNQQKQNRRKPRTDCPGYFFALAIGDHSSLFDCLAALFSLSFCRTATDYHGS